MMIWLRKLFREVVRWFRPDDSGRPLPATQPPQEPPPATPLPSPPAPPEATLRFEQCGLNRAERRALERARRRRDKLVTPQGPQPISRPVSSRSHHPKYAPPQEALNVIFADELLVDKLGGDDEVLVEESETWGEFSFRDTILEQLDRYFVYLKRMKARDPDAYGLYKELGATLMPYIATSAYGGEEKETPETFKKNIYLPSSFKQHRPAFGCIVFGANPVVERRELEGKKKRQFPKFLYFVKYANPPPEFQPMSGGDIYKLTVWWDQPQDRQYVKKYGKKGGVPQDFGVFVSADSTKIQVLRMIETRMVRIKKKRSLDSFEIPQRAWRIPGQYESWAKQHGVDAQTFLASLFADAVRDYEHSNYSMTRIAVSKDNMTAVFGVNIKRTAYFFQDRDIQLTDNGVKKRIFHIVRGHERKTKNGKTFVKFHFRGLREFEWAGYRVSITIPGRDHFMLPEFNIGVIDEYWKEEGKRYLTDPQMGKHLAKRIKEGLGGRA